MKNLTDNNYSKFLTNERINLSIAALLRHDNDEISKLIKTCPKKYYMQTDNGYVDKMNAFEKINFIATIIIQHYIYKIEITRITMLCNEDIPDIDKIHKNQICELTSIMAAIAEFCKFVGINYEDFIKYTGLKVMYQDFDNLFDKKAAINSNIVDDYFKKLLGLWPI
jgi:hypothetical protein